MQLLILGSAAGGGFPQWNCACRNCAGLRAGTFAGKARSQAQLAVEIEMGRWLLVGASPDLRSQIEATVSLQPRDGTLPSPIVGVVLTSGELDHVMGLLLLRELQPLVVHATPSIRRILREDNSMFGMLNRAPEQVVWKDIRPGDGFLLEFRNCSGLQCQTTPLGSRFPAYVTSDQRTKLSAHEALIGLVLESPEGKKMGYFPAVPEINGKLLEVLESCDLIFFDGTFWSDDELIRVRRSGHTAREMGHIPISASGGSLECLAGLRRPRKIFFHINNTNPVLDESGMEYGMVREAGWEIAEDGWQLNL
jgi:pyrroloquinoline quinone biosynthesis protein B